MTNTPHRTKTLRLRSSQRRTIAGALALAMLSAVLVPTFAATAASAQEVPAEASITIEPSTDLAFGVRARMTGEGFTPGANVFSVQCRPDWEIVDDCDLTTFGSAFVVEDGTFETTITVRREIDVFNTGAYDCASGPTQSCVVVAADVGDGISAEAPVFFDPDAVIQPLGTLAATPAESLMDRQQIEVMLDGDTLPVDSSFSVHQCPKGELRCEGAAIGYLYNYDGEVSLAGPVSVRRWLASGYDCGGAAGNCVLVARDTFTGRSASVAISFDPGAPVIAVSAVAEPTVDLPYRATIEVTGTDWGIDREIGVEQCGPNDVCRQAGYAYTYMGPSDLEPGTFQTMVQARRIIRSRILGDGEADIDCAVVACELRIYDYQDSQDEVRIPLSFDPNAEIPPPAEVTLEPTTDLPFQALITAIVTNAASDSFTDFYLCGEDEFNCRYITGAYANGEQSTFETTLLVRRIFTDFDLVATDCAVVECFIRASVYDNDDYRNFDFPLMFDPNTDIPPPPAISLSSDGQLSDLQALTVTGTGFGPSEFPGGGAYISQCSAAFCGSQRFVDVAIDGTFAAEYVVRRIVDTYGGPVDCALSDECYLRVEQNNFTPTEPIVLPLAFDPAVAPVERTVSLSERSGLIDGQQITIAGAGFTPGNGISIRQCLGPVNCFSLGFFEANVDGTFSQAVTVERDLYSNLDAIDCAAESCEVVVSESSGGPNSGTAVPLDFDPDGPAGVVTFEVTPNTGLIDGQQVQVSATNWPTDGCCGGDGGHGGPILLESEGIVSFGQCTVVNGERDECFYGHQEAVQTDGSFSSRAFARRFIGDNDCREVECRLLVETYSIQNGRRFVASTVMEYAADLEVVPGLTVVDEGVAAADGASLPVMLTRAHDEDVTVGYSLVEFGATIGSDVTPTEGTLTIAAGEVMGSIPIEVIDDGVAEANEAVLVVFDEPSAGTLGGLTFGGFVITDNDSGGIG